MNNILKIRESITITWVVSAGERPGAVPATGRPLPAVKSRKPPVTKQDSSRIPSTTGNGTAADAAAPSSSASVTAMNDKPLSKPGPFGVIVVIHHYHHHHFIYS